MTERAGALHPHRFGQHLGGDERIAVAVAADPRADAQERLEAAARQFRVLRRQFVLDRGVEARQFAEESVIVVREAIGDLVDHLEPLLAQHVGAPQQQDRAAKLLLVALDFEFVADVALARVEQPGDFEFAVDRALAPHFRRMRGQHRADQGVVEEVHERRAVEAGRARAGERVAHRARPRRGAFDHMGAVAADVVLILGDVGEMREIGKRAHDGERLLVVQTVEDRGELAARARLVVAMEADRGLADALDEIEDLAAFLLAHGVAEQAAEQADVVAQRLVLFGVGAKRRIDGEDVGHGSSFLAAAPASADARPHVKQAPRQSASGRKGRLQASRAAPQGL